MAVTPVVFWAVSAVMALMANTPLAVMVLGISRGIERLNKIMMPLFFVLFCVLLVRVAMLPGAIDGYAYLFMPRWEALANPQALELFRIVVLPKLGIVNAAPALERLAELEAVPSDPVLSNIEAGVREGLAKAGKDSDA